MRRLIAAGFVGAVLLMSASPASADIPPQRPTPWPEETKIPVKPKPTPSKPPPPVPAPPPKPSGFSAEAVSQVVAGAFLSAAIVAGGLWAVRRSRRVGREVALQRAV